MLPRLDSKRLLNLRQSYHSSSSRCNDNKTCTSSPLQRKSRSEKVNISTFIYFSIQGGILKKAFLVQFMCLSSKLECLSLLDTFYVIVVPTFSEAPNVPIQALNFNTRLEQKFLLVTNTLAYFQNFKKPYKTGSEMINVFSSFEDQDRYFKNLRKNHLRLLHLVNGVLS